MRYEHMSGLCVGSSTLQGFIVELTLRKHRAAVIKHTLDNWYSSGVPPHGLSYISQGLHHWLTQDGEWEVLHDHHLPPLLSTRRMY